MAKKDVKEEVKKEEPSPTDKYFRDDDDSQWEADDDDAIAEDKELIKVFYD